MKSVKPHIYRVKGKWHCKLTHYFKVLTGPGRESPKAAYLGLIVTYPNTGWLVREIKP